MIMDYSPRKRWQFMLFSVLCIYIEAVTSMNVLIFGEQSKADISTAAQSGLNNIVSGSNTFTVVNTDQGNFLDSVCALNFNTIDAIIDVSETVVDSDDLAKYINAPLMTTRDWSSFPSSSAALVPPTIRTSSSDYIQSVVTFINKLNATRESILILFSNKFDHSLLFPSLNTQAFVPVFMKEVNTTNLNEVVQFIKQVRVSEIILAAELSLVEQVVKKAVSANILNGVYHWYVVTLDLHSFECSSCGKGSFLLFQKKIQSSKMTTYNSLMSTHPTYKKDSKAVDLVFAYEAGQIMGKIYQKAVSAGTWLTPSSSFVCWNTSSTSISSQRFDRGAAITKMLTMDGMLGQINFNNTYQNQYSEIEINEVQFDGSSIKMTNTVKWTKTGGIGSHNININVLTKKHLKILVIPEPPFVIKLANGSFEGYSIDIVAKLSQAMNFDYTFYEQPDRQYGRVMDNGTFTGLIGAIAEKKYDMGVGAVTITSEREQVVDFSIPYYDYAAIQILMKKVIASTKGDQAFFLKAFTWEVWATVIATIIGTGFLICFVDRVSPFSFQNRLKLNEIRDGEADGKIFSIKESMWFVLGAYTQAGESFDPRSISCRVIVVGLWLFAYLMMAMYTANLSAQLTVAKLTSRPSSLEELAAQQKIRYSTLHNTSMQDYFYRMMKAEEDIFKFWTEKGINNLDKPKEAALMSTWKYPIEERYTNIYGRMKVWGFTSNIQETVEKIKKEDWAFFLETPIIKYQTLNDCDLVSVGEPFSQRPYGIVLQNNSPLLNELNLKILILQRDRVLEQLKVRWWNSGSKTCAVDDSSAGLGLDTLGGAFAFLAVGIGIAGIIFIGEKVVARIWGTEWARAAGNDPTVVRPMGMMSTVNVNLGSHIEIRRNSHLSNPMGSFRKPVNSQAGLKQGSNRLSIKENNNGDVSTNENAGNHPNVEAGLPNEKTNGASRGNVNQAYEVDNNNTNAGSNF